MTSNDSNTEREELVFNPSSRVFSENDERWQAQVQALLQDLRAAGAQVRQNYTPVPGAKGGVAEIILALGSSGALSVAVMAFKAWLARDKNRVITVKKSKTPGGEEITITGENISEKILEKAFQQLKK